MRFFFERLININITKTSVGLSLFRAAWICIGWLLVLLVIYLSLRSGPVFIAESFGDKLQHVFAYCVLMLWFSNYYQSRSLRMGYACGFVVLGVGLEFIQHLTGYRTFEIADMAADAIGVAVGWSLAPPRAPSVLAAIERLVMPAS